MTPTSSAVRASEPPIGARDPERREFIAASRALLAEAQKAGDSELVARVEALLAPHWGPEQRLPRTKFERLEAQRVCRLLLMKTRCYGVVYRWYDTFKAPFGWDVEDGLALNVRHLREAADGFGWVKGCGTVLECGCGAESLGLLLARHNERWIASDICRPDALDRLMQVFAPLGPFEFRIVNGATLDGIEPQSVDFVISRSFFEHLLEDDARQHLERVYRVLRPGGQFACLCPAGIGPPSDVTREFPEYDAPQGLHIKEYRVGELTALLKAAGFDRVHSRFLRLQGLGALPASLNRRNRVPPAVASVFETMAQSTWPLARRSPRGRALWAQVWGHLGAASVTLIATKAR